MLEVLMDTLKSTQDPAELQAIASLTWPTLIQALEKEEHAEQALYITALKPTYQQYLQPILQEMVISYVKSRKLSSLPTITTLIEQEDFFYFLGFDVQIDDSVLGDQYYADSDHLGSTKIIPEKGFHRLIQYLQEKIQQECKTVVFLTECQAIRIHEDNRIECQHQDQVKTLHGDKIIIAIAPNHYKAIEFRCDEYPRIKSATQYLHPSNFLKIAVLLNKPLSAENPMMVFVETVGIRFTPETKNSNILVGFLHKDFLQRDKVEQQLQDMLLEQGIQILDVKTYYETGESWFEQKMGFLPFINKPDSKRIYLGTITGCSDSVHSVLTSTCIQLGVDPKLLEIIFSASQPTDTLPIQTSSEGMLISFETLKQRNSTPPPLTTHSLEIGKPR